MSDREQWRAQLLSSSDGGGEALYGLASALGIDGHDFSRLALKLAGQRVIITLERRSQAPDFEHRLERTTLEAIVLTVKFEGAPDADASANIVLRRERDADVRDKDRGLTVEVQTGFPGFDHAVFIDNDSSEADVRRVLSKEATRQAVLRLLDAGHGSIRISATGVTVKQRLKRETVDVEAVLTALEDLLIVARAGGPREAARGKRGELLFGVGVALCTAAVAYAWLCYQWWSTTLLVLGIGVVAGAITAFLTRPAIEAACSGDSGSSKRSAAVLALFAFAAGAFVVGGLVHANGALDGSESELWRGVVADIQDTTSVDRNNKRSSRHTTVLRWQDGTETTITGSDLGVRKGDRVTERRHAGALGWEWVDERTFSSR